MSCLMDRGMNKQHFGGKKGHSSPPYLGIKVMMGCGISYIYQMNPWLMFWLRIYKKP